MIKFFRNIRQTLIMENNTSKYLKYAIGEILLIVIGILLHFKSTIEMKIENYKSCKIDNEINHN